jgi:predicted transcriptional regulator
MKTTNITIRFEADLKQKVEELAKLEKRTIASQASFLIEKGLLALEQQNKSYQEYLNNER